MWFCGSDLVHRIVLPDEGRRGNQENLNCPAIGKKN